MKKIIIILCFVFFNAFSQSQSGKVIYTYIAQGTKIESVLLFNKNESIYSLVIDRNAKKIDVETKEENSEVDNNNNINLKINLNNKIPNDLGMLTDLKNNTIIDNKFFVKNLKGNEFDTLFVKDKAKNIAWELQEKTKKINSFTCQKAVGKFRGRTYTVWFTYDIPVSLGPWKLNGLPGLILEASDTKNQYHFFAEKIELNTNDIKIESAEFLNKKYITPIEEREKLISNLDAIGDEISAKIKSSLPRGANSITTKKSINIIDNNDQLEINFDDISKKE